MKYDKVKEGIFIERPNRFIAKVLIDGREETVHVKNTGRCRELLLGGVKVFLSESDNPLRKTKYDLIAVLKKDKLFNIDSQAPNKVFYEYLLKNELFKNISYIKPECKWGNSRFDFYVEYENKKAFIEVKGVTKEEKGVLMFPDAPTLRGTKHLKELIECVKEGYEAYAVFIIQAEDALYFTPDWEKDELFARTLGDAKKAGVSILALRCSVTENTIAIKAFTEVRI